MTDAEWNKLKKDLDDGRVVIFSRKQAENLLRLEALTDTIENMAKREDAYNLVKGSLKSFAVFVSAMGAMFILFWDTIVVTVKGIVR